eukprot:GHVU01165301.1.p1 GENE.GHVU01165301.1~~GHVU01165301.1.p1  ORF type:complete len:221 (-),score=14.00 GHVU01165301.1:210-797(-)
MGDGLLGMDYLASADAWVGTKEGELYMQMNGYTVSCRLMSEGQAVRWLARPSRPTMIDPMSQGMVPCDVEERKTGVRAAEMANTSNKQADGDSTGLVTDTVWWPPEGVQVPTALVNRKEVLVPLMNMSSEAVEVGVRRVIAMPYSTRQRVPLQRSVRQRQQQQQTDQIRLQGCQNTWRICTLEAQVPCRTTMIRN